MSDKIYTTSTSEGTNDSISIRSEFQSKLNVFSEDEKEEITSGIDWFCKCDDDEETHLDSAIILGTLLTNSEQIIDEFKVNESLYQKMTETDDFIKALRDESWYQYKKKFNDSLNIDFQDDECRNAIKSLDEKANDNGIISFIAFTTINHCVNKPWFNEEKYERNYALLKREEENNYYGGLKNLVFEADIAQMLKAYHNEVAELLKAMWMAKNAETQKVETTPATYGDVGSCNSSNSPKNLSSNNQIVPTPAEVFPRPKYSEKVPTADVDPVISGIVKWVDATRKMERMTGYKAEVLAAKYLR